MALRKIQKERRDLQSPVHDVEGISGGPSLLSDDPMRPEVRDVDLHDRSKFDETARQWTLRYAT